jgi:hypothetical protein
MFFGFADVDRLLKMAADGRMAPLSRPVIFFYFNIHEDVRGLAKLSSLTTVDVALTSNSSQSFLKFKNHRTVNAAPTFWLKDLGMLVA